MSNPYTSPSISGYNTNAPADDGTQVASNQLTWAKHKTKLADPIKTYAEAVDAAALAAFGLVLGATVLEKSSNYTVATDDRGAFISVTGTTTITLPAAATAGEGFPLALVNTGSGIVTIDGDSSETINGSTTLSLIPGDSVALTSSGSDWVGVVAISSRDTITPKTADESKNSSTTFTTDTHITGIPFAADTYYAVDGLLKVSCASATPNIKFTFVLTGAGTTKSWLYFTSKNDNAAATGGEEHRADLHTATFSLTLDGSNDYAIRINGFLENNFAGTIGLQWAQQTSDATDITLREGSYLALRRA